ncbi:MAG TPA: hypothetical protein VLF91_05485 [Candidatus Saccharimonadales bacterium]|nr:hypothetical protein [Candidatus Saccharimonadales bacterium]
MQAPTVEPIHFEDVVGLPEVHADARRTIYERIEHTDQGIARTSRSVVTADEAVLGNHYHDFDQRFRGRGAGILYTAPKDNPTAVAAQQLPEDGWQFIIPAGMVMALRLHKGAVQIFESNQDYQDGANTHHVAIAS